MTFMMHESHWYSTPWRRVRPVEQAVFKSAVRNFKADIPVHTLTYTPSYLSQRLNNHTTVHVSPCVVVNGKSQQLIHSKRRVLFSHSNQRSLEAKPKSHQCHTCFVARNNACTAVLAYCRHQQWWDILLDSVFWFSYITHTAGVSSSVMHQHGLQVAKKLCDLKPSRQPLSAVLLQFCSLKLAPSS